MSLINFKIESKLKQTKYFVLSANGNDNTGINPNNIIFTIQDITLYVSVVTLLAKDKNKGFERSVYCNKYKTKIKNKNAANEYISFPESNFVGNNRLLY